MKFLIFGFSSTSSRKSCCFFQENLLYVGREYVQMRLLYRILCRPVRRWIAAHHSYHLPWTILSRKFPSVPNFFLRMPQSSSRGSQQPDECLNRAVAAACSHAIATANSKRKPLPHPHPAFIRLLTWWVNRLIIHIPDKSNILTIYTRSEHGTGFIKS